MADVGWVWEGQGLDPGVHPSIFGVGDGATFFGLRKVHFMFHPTNELALDKLNDKEEVVCDISKWRFKDTESGGSASYADGALDSVLSEAERLSAFSLQFPNVRGGFYDDMKGLMQRTGQGPEACGRIRAALKSHNPDMRLECVVYAHELSSPEFWRPIVSLIDVVSFWVWGYENLTTLEKDIDACRALFPDKPILMGCYMRDYPSASPMPMDSVRYQWGIVAKSLADGRLAGFDILATVLIDGHLEQATWIRDFIKDHS
jgi:hypothetical protein